MNTDDNTATVSLDDVKRFRREFGAIWHEAHNVANQRYPEPVHIGHIIPPTDHNKANRQAYRWALIVKNPNLKPEHKAAFDANFDAETYRHNRDCVIPIAEFLELKTKNVATKKLMAQIYELAFNRA